MYLKYNVFTFVFGFSYIKSCILFSFKNNLFCILELLSFNDKNQT